MIERRKNMKKKKMYDYRYIVYCYLDYDEDEIK